MNYRVVNEFPLIIDFFDLAMIIFVSISLRLPQSGDVGHSLFNIFGLKTDQLHDPACFFITGLDLVVLVQNHIKMVYHVYKSRVCDWGIIAVLEQIL